MEQPQVEKVLEHAQEALKNNDISLALQYLLQAAEIVPENADIIKQVARCYNVLGEFDRSLACWDLVLVTDPSDVEAQQGSTYFNALPFQFWLKRYREAVAELENRNYLKARDMLSDLVAEQDGFVSLYQLLGMCYFAESDIEAARRVWSRGLSLDIANPVLLKYLALRREDAGDVSGETASGRGWCKPLKSAGLALVAFLGIVLLVQVGLGLYKHAGKEALPDVDREAQNGRQQSALVGSRGLDGSRQLQQLGYSKDRNQGDQLSTNQELEYYETGYNAYLKNDWTTACRNLAVVVNMDSGNYLNREALYYLAQSYQFRKDYGRARKYYEKYLAEYPESNYADDSLFYMGCSAMAQQDLSAARKAFIRLGEVNPGSGYLSTQQYQKVMKPE